MNTYERVLRLEDLLRVMARARDTVGMAEARGHIESIRAELEGQTAEIRATAVVFGSCRTARPGCTAEIRLHLPGGTVATACLGHGDAVALEDFTRTHSVPLRYERPIDET